MIGDIPSTRDYVTIDFWNHVVCGYRAFNIRTGQWQNLPVPDKKFDLRTMTLVPREKRQ